MIPFDLHSTQICPIVISNSYKFSKENFVYNAENKFDVLYVEK